MAVAFDSYWRPFCLNLSCHPVDDSDLDQLTGFRLRELRLSHTHITDVGLAKMASMPHMHKLWILYLTGTRITDASAPALAKFECLQDLDLADTQITDASLKYLAGMTKLWRLDLGNTYVTDAGLKYLTGLSNLHQLYLCNTQVTDAGLMELAGLKQLERLDVYGSRVTPAGIALLQQVLPSCHIW